MSTTTAYHHGDLPTALVRAAIELLEEGGAGDLSLRAAARRAGVSTAAPYRHFADRNALLSSVAAVGIRELTMTLGAVQPEPRSEADLSDVAVAYVRFALDRPGLFRVMFAEPCDPTDTERVVAADVIMAYVNTAVQHVFPNVDSDAMATAVWALVHGLAFLHLDGKFDASSEVEVAARVRAAVAAALAASK